MNGQIKKEDCGRVRMQCGHGTCGLPEGTMFCRHGHATMLVPAPSAGPMWVQAIGRGCCPLCQQDPVGVPYKPGEK